MSDALGRGRPPEPHLGGDPGEGGGAGGSHVRGPARVHGVPEGGGRTGAGSPEHRGTVGETVRGSFPRTEDHDPDGILPGDRGGGGAALQHHRPVRAHGGAAGRVPEDAPVRYRSARPRTSQGIEGHIAGHGTGGGRRGFRETRSLDLLRPAFPGAVPGSFTARRRGPSGALRLHRPHRTRSLGSPPPCARHRESLLRDGARAMGPAQRSTAPAMVAP